MKPSHLRLVALFAGIASLLLLPSCATVPQSSVERRELIDDAQAQLQVMKDRSPGLRDALADAAGYAVFPNVGKGGLLFGGAFGRGTVYRQGEFIGYAKVTQASVGGVAGGRLSSMLLVFQNRDDIARFTDGKNVTFGAEATAIAIDTGVSDAPQYSNGVAVYILPRGGLMADASLSGQQFAFEKRGESSNPTARTDDEELSDLKP
jgi:lipid-binding SYLF domain-containing protein